MHHHYRGMAYQYHDHMNKLKDKRELLEQEYNAFGQTSEDDNTGIKKHIGNKLYEEASGQILQKVPKYDVFLNHRGADLKKTFVPDLYRALRRANRQPFFDTKSIEKGCHAFKSINEALSEVFVHIAIFSPSYAESKYCLNELCDILASKKTLIPVFYNVEPENLRWPENEMGPFARAFSYHIEKRRNEDVERWKSALKTSADIAGFKFVDYDNEVKLVEEIVAAVLKAIPTAPTYHLVGLKETSKYVVNMLHNMGNNVGVLGLYGMGGIGKTTLAKEVYNQEQAKFENKCFLKDVKDAKGTAIVDLQMKMIKDLLGEDIIKIFGDYANCFEIIQKKKILLVIDDISETNQFYQLIPDLKQLASGSRILITSRANDILNNIMSDVPHHVHYLVSGLSFPNALKLFIWNAFQRESLDEVDPSFHDCAKKITHACGGVPLALEIMGGFLADKKNQPKCWIEATSALKNNGDIMTSLRISYNGLVNDDDKYMFIDIACFMLGHPIHEALSIWDSLGEYSSSSWSLNRLVDKCLVKIDSEGLLSMHDLLQDMGRNIVIERARQNREVQSHIWDPLLASKIVEKKQGCWEKILALSLIGANSLKTWHAESFAKMSELRYLLLDGCLVNGDFSGWSKELRWLQWRHFPCETLPSTLNLSNLIVLNLANSVALTNIWYKNLEEEYLCQKLEILNLNKCIKLKELPHDIKKLVKLRFLNLQGCSSLISLPDSLGALTALEHLDLSNCSSLTTLPNINSLRNLQIFKMNWCTSLPKVPESLRSLSNLEELSVNGCELLQELPTSLSKLSKLVVLDLGGTALTELHEDVSQLHGCKEVILCKCKSLKQLPKSFGSFSNLEQLLLQGCNLLQELPSSFFKLSRLTTLDLGETSLSELPKDFGQLGALKKVLFQNCKNLVELPKSFGTLYNLEELRLTGCELLQMLPDSFSKLSKLAILYLAETTIRELPPDFGQLGMLKEINLRDCKRLIQLPESFGSLSNLEGVELHGCELLQKLPRSFSKLSKLIYLNLTHTSITQLPEDLGQLGALKRVYLEYCKSLIYLPKSFGSLFNLELLELNGCKQLQELPTSFSKLCDLTILNLTGTSVTQLPEDFGQLYSLKHLILLNCKSLIQLPKSFGSLSNLQNLRLNGCELLQELPSSFFKLTGLKLLDLGGTTLVETPKYFDQLCSLEKAIFINCKNLIYLPGSFGSLSNLEELLLNGCELLQELPSSFSNLSKLTILNLGGTTLKELPKDFGQLGSLKKVYFQDCKSLVHLSESFGSLSNLEELWLDGCEQLKKLPSLFYKLLKLKVLVMQCIPLKELPEDFDQLLTLEKAYFSFCKNLKLVPTTNFSSLSNLEVLHLDGCELLQELPPSICQLNKLRELCLNFTPLTELPEEFGQLQSLTQVELEGCNMLQMLPESFGCLEKLQKLNLKDCKSLIQLPKSFLNLSSLENLDLRGCRLLQTYPSSIEQVCIQVGISGGTHAMQVDGDEGNDGHGDSTNNGNSSSSIDNCLNFWSEMKELKRLQTQLPTVYLKSGCDEGMRLDLKKQCEEFIFQHRSLNYGGNSERAKLIEDLVVLLAVAYPHHNVMLVHPPHSQNLHECTHLELEVLASGKSFIFQLYVFKYGDFTLHGDGGHINWSFYGNFHRDSKKVTFYNR